MSSAPSLADRPGRLLVLAIVCASAATAATVWVLLAAPREALVGRPGQHDQATGAVAVCLDCHVPFVGTPASRCLAPGCHGALATGTPPRFGPAMPVRFHVALRDLRCGHCHEEHRGSHARRAFDHRIVPDGARRACRRCHPADGQPDHARSDSVSCGTCHGWSKWTGARMDHRRVSAEPCELCHPRPDDRRHAAVAGACDDCHGVDRWPLAAAQDAAK